MENIFLTACEWLSLSLTTPTIIMGIAVIVLWAKPAWRAITSSRVKRSDTQWLVLGIFISFLGGVLDNAYWGLAWSSDYFGLPTKENLFQYGVVSNIPFRQIAGLAAACCHVRGAVKPGDKAFRNLNIFAGALTALTMSALIIARPSA